MLFRSGSDLIQSDVPVIGINVFERQHEKLQYKVEQLYERTRSQFELPPDQRQVELLHEYLGDDYGLPTDEMLNAVRLMARLEGVLLDPVYSGKALAGLIDLIISGRFTTDSKVLFLHTGGLPSLFAYRDVLQS